MFRLLSNQYQCYTSALLGRLHKVDSYYECNILARNIAVSVHDGYAVQRGAALYVRTTGCGDLSMCCHTSRCCGAGCVVGVSAHRHLTSYDEE